MKWPESCLDGEVAKLTCIPFLFQNLVRGVLIFAGIAAVIIIMLAGFKFINSSGDPKQAEGARNQLMFGILGLVIILLSFGIISVISVMTHTPCITTFGFGNCIPKP